MIDVILYTKPGCHLCEEVAAHLAALQTHYPHRVTAVDIRQDQALMARYHLSIPVVRIGSSELHAPISAADLAAALAAQP